MGFQIRDGGGSGRNAHLSEENQVLVRAENNELQHHVAWKDAQTYQAIASDGGITAKTQTILHLKNTSQTQYLVISYIRLLDMTSITTNAAGHYFTFGFDDTVSSGGSAVTPVNTNRNSGNTADIVATTGDPTMGGGFVEIDRAYTVAGNQITYNKAGSIILGLNNTFDIRLTSTGTGTAGARVTFMMLDKDRVE